jgi:hypothetical protein
LLKSRDPHLASGEKEKPKEGRREREGKGREGKQAASLIREEERQRKERGRKGRKSLSVVWCFFPF